MKNVFNKLRIALMVLVIMTLSTTQVWAGNAYGVITEITTASDFIYFYVSGASYDSCAKNSRYVLNTLGPFGKNSYAMLLFAKSTGTPVSVVSAHTCSTLVNDAEDINNLSLSQ